MIRFLAGVAGVVLLTSSCALYSEIEIEPLAPEPRRARHSRSLTELVERGQFAQAASLSNRVDSQKRQSISELADLGKAELACGRLESARRHLLQAMSLGPRSALRGALAWDLSQLEFTRNNLPAAAQWARIAGDNGLSIRAWYLQYLDGLGDERIYAFSSFDTVELPLKAGRPIIPRMAATINGKADVEAVIDSGAAMSIVSKGLADRLAVRRLGNFTGTFYGLTGEPIQVWFGVLDQVQLGSLTIRGVPVAIMPDEKLDFVVANREPYSMNFLLGTNLLKELWLELDFRRHRVRLRALRNADKSPATDQNLFFESFRPLVHAAIQKQRWYPFILDTGSEITFLNSSKISNTPVASMAQIHGALLQGLGGRNKRGSMVKNVGIGIDEWSGSFRNLPLYGSEYSNAVGIVGQNLLKHFRVEIDFGKMRVELHPHANVTYSPSLPPAPASPQDDDG